MEKHRRSRHLSWFAKGEDVFVYHDLVGDILRMDAKLVGFVEFFAEPRAASEARERFAGEFAKEDLDAFLEILPAHRVLVREGVDEKLALDWFHPLRGPWILVFEDTVGYVARSTDEVVLEELAPFERRVFRLCDGERTIGEIAHELGGEAREAIFQWTDSERQVLKLLEKPASASKKLPPYAESTMPFARFERPAERSERASTREYHAKEIASADEQFEVGETTLSHAFRAPHPALGGATYAARLVRALEERDLLAAKTRTIVEVGGGVGWFAKGALEALEGRSLSWTICDLAPELQRSQREKVTDARARLVRGDAERLPLRSASVDLLVANEMIADLETVRVKKGSAEAAALERAHGISLADAPEDFWVNAGALRFVAEVARVLAPGGAAVVTEFGELDAYPVESTHLDHREFSIHFGHVRAAAERAGLEARVVLVPALLELDETVPVLATNRSFFRALRALLARKGFRLEKLAYTREQLEALLAGSGFALSALEGVKLLPAGERVLGLRPREFKALLLRKRAPIARRSLDV